MEMRPVGAGELDEFERVGSIAFGRPHDPGRAAASREHLEIDRTLAAVDGKDIVGTASAHSFTMTVPGGELAAGGVGGVTVLPTHRRRGILRGMMRRQLDDFRSRGEPLACLWPSEAAIYGRFGYGPSGPAGHWAADTRDVRFVPEALELAGGASVQVRLAAADDARPAMEQVYDAVRRRTPGMIRRTEPWWDAVLRDRNGSVLRVVIEDSGVPVAYASYGVESAWSAGGPDSRLHVHEAVHSTAAGLAALWTYLFAVDLVRTVDAWNRPGDDPLPWLLADRRALRRTAGDGVWLRLVDLPTALASRSYRHNGEAVFEVADRFCPWNEGRWVLEAGPDGARARPTDRPADLALDTSLLASAFLGGNRLAPLARAGLLTEVVPGAAAAADEVFAWDPLPWTPFNF